MEQNKSKLGSPLVLGAVGILLIVALYLGYQFMPSSVSVAPTTNSKPDPNAEFYKAMAAKCDGDITKLSPEDQKAVFERAGSPGYARQILLGYAPKK